MFRSEHNPWIEPFEAVSKATYATTKIDEKKHVAIAVVDNTGWVSLVAAFVYTILNGGLVEIEGMFVERELVARNDPNVAFVFPHYTCDALIVVVDLLRRYFDLQK